MSFFLMEFFWCQAPASDNHSGGGKKSVPADLKKKKEEVKKQPVNKKYRNKQLEL